MPTLWPIDPHRREKQLSFRDSPQTDQASALEPARSDSAAGRERITLESNGEIGGEQTAEIGTGLGRDEAHMSPPCAGTPSLA